MYFKIALLCFAVLGQAATIPKASGHSSSSRIHSFSATKHATRVDTTTLPTQKTVSTRPSSRVTKLSNPMESSNDTSLRSHVFFGVKSTSLEDQSKASFNFSQNPVFAHSGKWTQISCNSIIAGKALPSWWKSSGAAGT